MWEGIIIYTLWGILAVCVFAIFLYFIMRPIAELYFYLEEVFEDFRAWRSKRKSNPAP